MVAKPVFSIIRKHSSRTNLANHLKFSRCQNKEHIGLYAEAVASKKLKEAAQEVTVKEIEVLLPQQKQAKLSAFVNNVYRST